MGRKLSLRKSAPGILAVRRNPVAQAPMNEVGRLIQSYGDQHGLDVSRNTHVPLDHERHRAIADAFEAMKHDPSHPESLASHAAMRGELEQQYEHALRSGFRFTPWHGEGQPYANSNDMMDDVLGNRHLYFFKTENGFGDGHDDQGAYSDHPLLSKSPYHIAGYDATHNDLLRAVHDLYGHAAHGHNFGPTGEDRAYHAHLQMFHPESHHALALNTRAQNAWVNYGSHLRRPDGSLPKIKDHDYTPLANRPFAEQKIGALPAFVARPHWDLHPDFGKAMPFRPEITDLKRRLQAGPSMGGYGHLLPRFMEAISLHPTGDHERDFAGLTGVQKTMFMRYLDGHPETAFGDNLSDASGPPQNNLQYRNVDKPGWSVHFTDHAPSIMRQGFKYGHEGYEGVHYTTAKSDNERQSKPGYNFAFRAGDPEILREAGRSGYGVNAVVFPSGGVNAYHKFDEENQHVFHGPSVDPLHVHMIQRTGFNQDSQWVVRDATGRKRFSGPIADAVRHVQDNHEQLARAKIKAWGGGLVPGVHPTAFREYRSPEVWSSRGPRPGSLTKALALVKGHLPGRVLALRLAREREKVNRNPTEAQSEAGNYSKAHIPWKGHRISIETVKGARRKGKSFVSPPLPCDYGQFVGEKTGNDGDAIDVLLGPHLESEAVYIINQMKWPKMVELDEHKIVLGCRSRREAVALYLGMYHKGWKCGPVTAMTLEQFKEWLATGDRSKPA